MKTLVVLFNLKPGVTAAEYERWATATDLPTVRSLPSVRSFELYRAEGVLGSEAASPYAYVEFIDCLSLETLFADIGTPLMQHVAAEFQAFARDPLFIITERCS